MMKLENNHLVIIIIHNCMNSIIIQHYNNIIIDSAKNQWVIKLE